ncbi:ead/Ea22-like family protein [Pseudomonas aeruginosa]|uniref:ead/Ea22-like family protein n=1 Tax=Pseudomonas aeruginosa TaxID=287 RepID=UPI000A672897|nr:ead/Ea22-like family protein [Pseudomonas aeruginosa]
MDTNKLKELAERATPGEWSAVWEEGDDTAWPNLFPIIQAENGETVIGNEGFYSDLEQDKANAQFCAAANPKTVLALLDEIDGLKAENEALLLGMRAILNAYDYADQYNKEGVAVEVMEDLRTLFKGATQ